MAFLDVSANRSPDSECRPASQTTADELYLHRSIFTAYGIIFNIRHYQWVPASDSTTIVRRLNSPSGRYLLARVKGSSWLVLTLSQPTRDLESLITRSPAAQPANTMKQKILSTDNGQPEIAAAQHCELFERIAFRHCDSIRILPDVHGSNKD